MTSLAIVVPCYNEEKVLAETASRLAEVLAGLKRSEKVSPASRIYFVDDGSTDSTWTMIVKEAERRPYVKGIKLSRNCGHQIALLAGLFECDGDAVISVDADLQDDLAAIHQMVEAFNCGSEIVFGVRKSRGSDTFFKRLTAESYYRMLALFGVPVIFNHADYRLMSRRAVEALRQYGEVNLFLRGLIPQIGLQTSIVYYNRAQRFAGNSKYPPRKMLSLAAQGVTSFSLAPLRLISGIGVAVSLTSFLLSIWAIGAKLLTNAAVPGWASTVLPIYFLGGVQLLALGVIGEYLGKMYMETKRRPRYFIDRTT